MTDMNSPPTRIDLLLSLQRALIGEVHAELRAASIEADPFGKIVKLRFEYVGEPSEEARECGSCAATEVIADFPAPWGIEEEHVARPLPAKCEPHGHLAYLRIEGWDDPQLGTNAACLGESIPHELSKL